jgi:phasin family protein
MTTLNDPFQKYVDFQRQAYEPMRAFGGIAAETFERLARQNYAVLGDYVEFMVEQAKLPTQTADINELFGKQIERSRAYGEQLVKRAQEYADIARTAQEKAQVAATAAAGEGRHHKKAA